MDGNRSLIRRILASEGKLAPASARKHYKSMPVTPRPDRLPGDGLAASSPPKFATALRPPRRTFSEGGTAVTA